MDFVDYKGRKIQLADESWEHIKDDHPEISLQEISDILIDPFEVRQSSNIDFAELFYQQRVHPEGKTRFRVVVVKIMKDGNFISTAYTASSMKAGIALHKKGQEV